MLLLICSAGLYNDLWSFNLSTGYWTAMTPIGPVPYPRYWFGFTSTPDGLLYLFGGHGPDSTGFRE